MSTQTMTLEQVRDSIARVIANRPPHKVPLDYPMYLAAIDAHLATRDVTVSDEDVERAITAYWSRIPEHIKKCVVSWSGEYEIKAMRAAIQADRQRVGGVDLRRAFIRIAQYGAEYAYRHKDWSLESLQDGCEEHIDSWIKQAMDGEALLTQRARPGWKLVPVEYIEAVEKASGIASAFSPCIDMVERDGGDDHEDPSCAIHHILYYAHFILNRTPDAPTHDDAEGSV